MILRVLDWKRFPIRDKLILIYIVISIIPVTTLGYYLTNSLSSSLMKNMKQANRASVQIISRDLSDLMNSFQNVISSFATDNDNIIDFLTTSFDSDLKAYEAYMRDIAPVVNKAKNGQVPLQVKVLSGNSTISLSRNFVTRIYEEGLAFETLPGKELLQKMKPINWDGVKSIDDRKYLVCYTPIGDYTHFGDTIALLYTYMDISEFKKLVSMPQDSENLIFFTDDRNNVIFSNTGAGEVSEVRDGSICLIEGKRYMVLSESISNKRLSISNWRILYYVPLKQLDESSSSIWKTTLLLVFICLFLTFIIIGAFAGSLNSRIKKLIRIMRTFESGDTKSRVENRYSDELGQLTVIFNGMADKIDHLISETLMTRIKLQETEIEMQKAENANKDAQLMYLQSQINPHYLYNTLESIRMRTLVNGDSRTAQIIRLFANSFREIMYSKEKNTTIEKELALVRDFFTIQKYRFGNKLEYVINCEEGLEYVKIPKFSLQPLVENSIFHGTELATHQGRVEVSIYREGERVVLAVKDNGAGMDIDRLKDLNAFVKGESENGRGLALRNIYSRLKILYRDRLDFEIVSGTGQGTAIYIRIPEVA